MAEYRKAIKRRMVVFIVCAVCALLFVGSAGVYGYLRSMDSETHLRDFSTGMYTGIMFAMAVGMIVQIVLMRKGLKDEAKLKAMYVQEHDERYLMIQSKTGGWALQFVLWVILIMGMGILFAGQEIAGFTLLMAATFIVFTKIGLTFYYNKKY